jgi:hypothetical protein
MASAYQSAAYTAIIAAFDDEHERALLFADPISRAVACDRAVRNYCRAYRRFAERVPDSEAEAADMLETLLGFGEEAALLHEVAPTIEETVADLRSGRDAPTMSVRLGALYEAVACIAGDDAAEAVLVRSVLQGVSRQRPARSRPLPARGSVSHAFASPERAMALKCD